MLDWWDREKDYLKFPHTRPHYDVLGDRYRAFQRYYEGWMDELREMAK